MTYTRQNLHRRAAEYYHLLSKPRDDWKELADLEPTLHEIEHRIGGEDYDIAARLLLDIDYEYLSVMGHYGIAIRLHGILANRIKNMDLKCRSQHSLARSYYDMGQLQQAVNFDTEALKIAVELSDPILQATCLGGLGFSYSGLGKSDLALSHYKKALLTLPKENDSADRAWYLNGLGLVFFDQGKYDKAVEYYLRGRQVAPPDPDGQIAASMCLANISESLVFQSRFGEAQDYAIESIGLARKYSYTAGLSYGNYFLALANLYSNPPMLSNARAAAEEACKHYEPILNHSAWALLGVILLRQGDIGAAHDAFEAALRESQGLLSDNPSDCNALDTQGIAYCGLELCGIHGKAKMAMEAFITARAVSSDPGIVIQYVRLLDALLLVDKKGTLLPVREYLGKYLSTNL